MRFVSFNILILSILLPPLLHMFTIQMLENSLPKKYLSKIKITYTGDTSVLYNGDVRLKDVINKNINQYLKQSVMIAWGTKIRVIVKTKSGKILYPVPYMGKDDSLLALSPTQIAADNASLMNEGIGIKVNVIIELESLLSKTILAFYISCSLILLYFYYKVRKKKAIQEDLEQRREIERLLEMEKKHKEKLSSLARYKDNLTSELATIRDDLEDEKRRASRNEDDMIEEIDLLEKEIETNLALQAEKQQKIDELNERISRFDKGKSLQKQIRASDLIRKRFNALYKNITITEKAILGFDNLAGDIKLKAEEIIHQLNEDPKLVIIKRKVFVKKDSETILEAVFGYKGRLYFSKTKDNKVEILAIGTKNTQKKDLAFLSKL